MEVHYNVLELTDTDSLLWQALFEKSQVLVTSVSLSSTFFPLFFPHLLQEPY
jgi:hypothetical protein